MRRSNYCVWLPEDLLESMFSSWPFHSLRHFNWLYNCFVGQQISFPALCGINMQKYDEHVEENSELHTSIMVNFLKFVLKYKAIENSTLFRTRVTFVVSVYLRIQRRPIVVIELKLPMFLDMSVMLISRIQCCTTSSFWKLKFLFLLQAYELRVGFRQNFLFC